LIEVYTFVNSNYETKRDNTYVIIEFLDRSRITDFNEILFTNHQGYIIDVSLEDYFNTKGNYLDKRDVN